VSDLNYQDLREGGNLLPKTFLPNAATSYFPNTGHPLLRLLRSEGCHDSRVLSVENSISASGDIPDHPHFWKTIARMAPSSGPRLKVVEAQVEIPLRDLRGGVPLPALEIVTILLNRK
jgi:hypothetical protein